MPLSASSSGRRARLLSAAVALAIASLIPSCLDANATTATTDSGTTGNDTGTSHVPDAGTSFDAHTGVDVTTTGSDSGAKEASAASDAAVVPLCMNPTVADKACFSCVDTMCQVDVGPAIACTSFYTCFAACDCSDATCLGKCVSAAPTSCDTALENLNTCQTTTCASACNPPTEAGTTDAVAPAGDAGATCKNPTATQKACATCEETNCASVVSNEKSACSGTFATCFDACSCTDTSCITTCAEAAPSGCQTALEALQSCQTGTACNATCSGTATDGGTKDDGGTTSGKIPDCSDPTSAEQMLYTACSACDTTSCATEVTAAVSGCSAYYSCFGACKCSDSSCQTTCEADITAGCSTAIDELATCQNTFCAADCD